MNEHNLFYVKEDVIQWMTQVYPEKKKNENTCNGFRTNKLPTRALDALPLSYRRLVSWQARPWHKVRSGLTVSMGLSICVAYADDDENEDGKFKPAWSFK